PCGGRVPGPHWPRHRAHRNFQRRAWRFGSHGLYGREHPSRICPHRSARHVSLAHAQIGGGGTVSYCPSSGAAGSAVAGRSRQTSPRGIGIVDARRAASDGQYLWTAGRKNCESSLGLGRAEPGSGADALQRPLVPRSRFRTRLTAGVRQQNKLSMATELISKKTRQEFREWLVGWVLRKIEDLFDNHDVKHINLPPEQLPS